MISPILFLLPLTATAAALARPQADNTLQAHRPDDFMVPTATPENVATLSAGFLAPTSTSDEIAHRPDDLMSPSSNSAGLQFSFPQPTTTPAPSTTQAVPGLNPSLISWASWLTGAPPAPAMTYAPSDISFASWANPSTLTQTPTPSSSSSSSSPPSPSPYPEGSNPGDFTLCTDTAFSGLCTTIHSVTFQCQNLPPEYQRRATSIRPDKNQTCVFYDDEDCHGRSDWMRWPGSGNMRGRRFDERVVSWMCREDGCEGVRGPGGCGENADGTPKVWG